MGRSLILTFTCLFLIFLIFPCSVSIGSDTIQTGQSLFSNDTIMSKEGKFELGFFVPDNSSNSYIGIWYGNIPNRTVVWVANRDNPIPFSSCNRSRLEMSTGSLYLYGSNSEIIWAVGAPTATEAVILDTGNLVLSNGSGILWQSFDYPTDTWLPGLRVGFRLFSDSETKLVSWRGSDNPALGSFSIGMEPNGGTELYIWRSNSNSSQRLWRSGEWQGGNFPSVFRGPQFFNFTYVSRDGIVSLTYNVFNESVLSRIVIDHLGRMVQYVWSEVNKEWRLYLVEPRDSCRRYAICGPNGMCDASSSPSCLCLKGFKPQYVQDWIAADFSGGCVRMAPRYCIERDNTAQYTLVSNVTLPANLDLLAVSMPVCRYACSMNCSCNAYAYSGDGGCFLFMGELLDLVRLFGNSPGGDLYVRTDSIAPSKGKRKVVRLGLILPITAAAILICGFFLWYVLRKLKRKGLQGSHQNILLLDLNSNLSANNKRASVGNNPGEENKDKYELPVFSFSSISTATKNFSSTNKLGEGGFGPVYKGEVLNGQFVAVKRLSTRSGQGLEDFKNEIEVIAKLQHRNLVGILGCCIEQDEKIIVYEYMSNKSLDSYLFDPTKQELLDWDRRAHVIEGIAQGLLYLHHYSRLRIIHRDLKASNILLDAEMNPKISDFGMARIFGGKEMQANTKRIVGTYGYMSPEYAMEGLFSIKSDVFAFGVLLLEIISGKKNTGFYGSDYISLLGYAWKLWTKSVAIGLIDPQLDVSSSSSVPLRYIQVGLLCVQESPTDRPTMMDVIAMLSNEQIELASPNHPAFTMGRTSAKKAVSDQDKVEICSVNDLTLSLMKAR